MSKKSGARRSGNPAKRAAQQQDHEDLALEAAALATVFQQLGNADGEVNAWRWAIYGTALRLVNEGASKPTVSLTQVGDVRAEAIIAAFESYQSPLTYDGSQPANVPQEWTSTLEHGERTALVGEFLKSARIDPAAYMEWIEHFTLALEGCNTKEFATVSASLLKLRDAPHIPTMMRLLDPSDFASHLLSESNPPH